MQGKGRNEIPLYAFGEISTVSNMARDNNTIKLHAMLARVGQLY